MIHLAIYHWPPIKTSPDHGGTYSTERDIVRFGSSPPGLASHQWSPKGVAIKMSVEGFVSRRQVLMG
ncbi:hypothetical protein LR48_Vigan03g131800 [Vigna angularis]|uniref:Uncharacterized protein n=1 Tax=Phaseolus angularis TaxID=3914 RepID=A0A0L9U572_PHAAN|nr:hypothetical protein LR48_Vigan03g131800 [Vigna angularis]